MVKKSQEKPQKGDKTNKQTINDSIVLQVVVSMVIRTLTHIDGTVESTLQVVGYGVPFV